MTTATLTGGFTYASPTNSATATGWFTYITVSSAVALLFRANGTDGSTSFADDSSHHFSLAAAGDAKIKTTQSKFGGSSAYFDGTGDSVKHTTAESSLNLSGDFTIEAWIYPTANTNLWGGIFCSGATSFNSSAAALMFTSGRKIRFGWYSANPIFDSVSLIPLNAWTHVAVVRRGTALQMFVNGVLDNTATNSQTLPFGNNGFTIGSNLWDGTNGNFAGYIDDLRVINGAAYYWGAFDPPTEELTTLAGATFASSLAAESTLSANLRTFDRLQSTIAAQSTLDGIDFGYWLSDVTASGSYEYIAPLTMTLTGYYEYILEYPTIKASAYEYDEPNWLLPNGYEYVVAQAYAVDGFEFDYFWPDPPGSSERVFRRVTALPFTLPAGLGSSRAASAVLSSARAVFSLRRNGTEFGTITYTSDTPYGVLTSGYDVAFDTLDILEVVAPASPDATLAGVFATFVGIRGSASSGSLRSALAAKSALVSTFDPSRLTSLLTVESTFGMGVIRPANNLASTLLSASTVIYSALTDRESLRTPASPSQRFVLFGRLTVTNDPELFR